MSEWKVIRGKLQDWSVGYKTPQVGFTAVAQQPAGWGEVDTSPSIVYG